MLVLEFYDTRDQQDFLLTTKDIWDALRESYLKKQDLAAVYALRTKIKATKQNNLPITAYFNFLLGLWMELHHYQSLKMVCTEDAKTLTASNEKQNLLISWQGLMWNLIR